MSVLRASRPVAVLLLFVLWPTLGLAESAPSAGIVTQLQGKATIVRPVVTQPIPLKFKDDVFFRDQVVTGESSLVRVLLGGKALVTVRELSTFTIIDEPKRAAVDLKNGKLAVGVAKTLLDAGEEIDVRTPNAIVGIRGSLVIVSVVTSGGVPQSTFTALDASVPITVTPIGGMGGSVALRVNQTVGVSGSGSTTVVGPVQNITPDVARREAQTASAPHGGDQTLTSPMAADISLAKFQQATALATLIAPPSTSTTQTPPPSDSSLTSATQTQLFQESGPTLNATPQTVVSSPPPVPPLPVPPPVVSPPPVSPPPVPPVVISGQDLVLGPNDTLKTFTGITNSTDTSPAVTVINSTVIGPDNLIKVDPEANASLAGPLLTVSGSRTTPSALSANLSVVDIRGAISSTSANAFISVDPTIFTTSDFLRIVGGSLAVSGPLLTDAQGIYAVAGDFISISGGGGLSGSSPSALVQFAGSKVFVGALSAETPSRFFSLDGTGSRANLGGSLASLSSGSVLVVNGAAGSAVLELALGSNLLSPSASPVLSLSDSTLALGPGVKGFLVSGGTATVGGALIRATGASSVLADQTIPLVDLLNATVNVNGALIRLEGGSTLQSGAVKVSGGSLTADSLLSTDGDGNTATVTGTVLDLSNTTVTLRTPEDKPVVDNDTTSLVLGLNQPAYRLSSSALTLTGAGERLIKFGDSGGTVPTESGIALIATGTTSAASTIDLKGTLLDLAAVNSTATQALIQLGHTIVNQTATNDALISALVPSDLRTTLAGPMLSGVSAVINAPGNLFHLAGGSLTSNVVVPFFSFDLSAINTGQQTVLVDNGSLLNLKGALQSAQSTTFKVGDPTINAYSLVNILDGATIASTGSSPLLAFDASSVDGGNILSIRRSPSTLARSTLTLSGPLFSAVNGSFFDTSSLGLKPNPCCSLVSVTQGGQLSSTTTAPLIQLTNSTVKAGPDAESGGSVFNLSDTFSGAAPTELIAPSKVTLAGPLLSATDGALSALFSLLSVARSDFSSGSGDPLIQLNGTTVTLGGVDPIADVPTRGRVLSLSASATTPASLVLHGPLFAATNATVSSTDTMFGFFDGSTFSSSTASPLISFSGGSAIAGAGALTGLSYNFISVASGLGLSPTVSLAGPLLSASNTTLKNGDPTKNATSFLFIGDSSKVTSSTTAPLLSFDNASLDTSGDVLSLRRSLSTADPTRLSLSGPLFSAINGSTFNTTSLGNGSACCAGFGVRQAAELIDTTTAPLIQLSGSTFNAGPDAQSGGDFFGMSDNSSDGPVTAPAKVSLAGPLLSATGGNISALFSLLSVGRSSFTSTSPDPLIQLNGTTVTLGGVDPIADVPTRGRVLSLSASATTPASLVLHGPLFGATNATVSSTDTMFGFFDGSTFSSSTAHPLITFSGGSATAGAGALAGLSGNLIAVGSGTLGLPPTVSLAGPLLSASNTTLKNGDPTKNAFSFLFIGDSSKVTSTSTAPLLSFDNASLDTSGGGINLRRSLSTTDPTRLSLSGPLFSAINRSIFNTTSLGNGSTCCDAFFIAQGAQLSSTTALPLIQLTNSTLSAGPDPQSGGDVIGVFDTYTTASPKELVAPATVTLSGPLLSASGSTVSALFSLLNVTRSSLSSTSTEPLLQLSFTTINLGGTDPFTNSPTSGFLFVENSATGGSNAPTTVSLRGPFLQAVSSTLTTSAVGIGVFNGASLASGTASPFVALDNTSLTTGAGSGGDLLNVSGLGGPTGTTTSSASFNGPLLLMSNGSNVILQRDVIIGSSDATITGTGSAPFIQVGGGSTLTTGSSGAVAGLGNGTKLNLAGPLLSVASVLNAPGGLANISNRGQLTVTGSTDPLVSFSAGRSTVAGNPGSSMFNLLGTATALDPESGLTLGTDRPIQGPLKQDQTRPVLTSLLETSGDTVTVTGQRVMNIDTALLEATAPLLSQKAGSVMTSSVDAINLNSRANVSLAGGSLIRLDNSILNVNGGSLVNVNASKLTVSGDLVTLLNGATLTVFNGPLIMVSGSGFVNITGSLINFGGTSGNKVTITNSLCPCSLFGGIPVALQNGALAANVQISNPIKNNFGQLILSPNTALAVVNGGGSKLTVKGQ